MPKNRTRNKQPVLSGNPSTSKTPTYLGPANLDQGHLAWRFSNSDLDGPFSCANLAIQEFKDMWDRLRAFEKMTPAQLRDAGSLHGVSVVQMSKAAKERLLKIKLDDIETLYSFRVDGACRLWCVKFENIFSVLWWDRNHQVYTTPKRHT